jgi:hypothetical protein
MLGHSKPMCGAQVQEALQTVPHKQNIVSPPSIIVMRCAWCAMMACYVLESSERVVGDVA